MRAGAEHERFNRAAEEFAAHPTNPRPVVEMMHLALDEGQTRLALWAAKWLKDKQNITIVRDETQGQVNAIAAAADHIL